MFRRSLATLSMGAALLLLIVPAAAMRAATIWVYPSTQCNGTLQQCIDGTSSGDEVLLETDTLINEQVTIADKSLTLAAGPGFSPEILSLILRTTSAATGALGMLVTHVQVSNTLFLQIGGGTGTVATVDHVTAQSSGADPGIYGVVSVGSTITVQNSSVTQAGFYPGIELVANNGNQQNLVWNVIANTVSGELATMTQAGIYLSASDAGSVHAGVYNNSIWDDGQGLNQGNHGGIVLFARENGPTEFDIVGNSMDTLHGDGVVAENEQQSPSAFGLKVFDNVISHASKYPIHLVNDSGTTGPFVTDGGSNDFFHNGQPSHLLGNSIGVNLNAAPRFMNAANGNLRLADSSPLIDAGVTCSPAGVAGPDAAGLDRLAGPSVDIGAFEHGAGPAGIVDVGTSGPDSEVGGPHPDILCGYGGNDKLFGREGADYLDGGAGSDQLHGGPGRDQLFGRGGNDVLCARDGAPGDVLDGGAGTDSSIADPGDTTVSVEQHGGPC